MPSGPSDAERPPKGAKVATTALVPVRIPEVADEPTPLEDRILAAVEAQAVKAWDAGK